MDQFQKPVSNATKDSVQVKTPEKKKAAKISKITVFHIGEMNPEMSEASKQIGICVGGANYELIQYLADMNIPTWMTKRAMDLTFHSRTNDANAVNKVHFDEVPHFFLRSMGPNASVNFTSCSFEQIVNDKELLRYQNFISTRISQIYDLPNQAMVLEGVHIQFEVYFVKVPISYYINLMFIIFY